MENLEAARARTKEIAAEFHAKNDPTGWFEALYSEAAGDNGKIPWADLVPNRFFVGFAERTELNGDGKTALVVGCGLGDDAKFLADRGFKVTAFDISPTAIDWAKKLYGEGGIDFVAADLFNPPAEWSGAFDFVLEIYTIQPLPIELRPRVIDAIAAFVKPGGQLVVVTRCREDDEEPNELPYPLSRRDLAQFGANGLTEISLEKVDGDEDPPIPRFIVSYNREAGK